MSLKSFISTNSHPFVVDPEDVDVTEDKVVYGTEHNSTFLECVPRSPQATVTWLVQRDDRKEEVRWWGNTHRNPNISTLRAGSFWEADVGCREGSGKWLPGRLPVLHESGTCSTHLTVIWHVVGIRRLFFKGRHTAARSLLISPWPHAADDAHKVLFQSTT